MPITSISTAVRDVTVLEEGSGAPLVYLHGYADVHGLTEELFPFHRNLARQCRLIAPAHPGCNGSDDLSEGYGIDDVVFHYLEVFDALGLDQVDLVGHCVGGWIAAELAVRHPEKIKSLGLIGACGLFVSDELIGDIFMHSQPERGVDYATLRHMLFSASDAPLALHYYPDGRGDLDVEVRRYEMLRFGSFIGFKPPYFYNRYLIDRLRRVQMPSLVVWGAEDHMVPITHAQAYADRLSGARDPVIVATTGHAVHLEAPDTVAGVFKTFLK